MVVLKDKTLPKISITLGLAVAEGCWLSNGRVRTPNGKTGDKWGAMPTGLTKDLTISIGVPKDKTPPNFSIRLGQGLTEG